MSKGRFGVHGGQYIPETLMNAMLELEEAYKKYKDDPEFNRELTEMLNEYAGRPSRLYYAERMTKDLGGAKIYLKRGSEPHRSAQDQQRNRTDAPCQENGQDKSYRGDRCRTAWSCNSYSCSHDGHGVRYIWVRRTRSDRLSTCTE